MNLRVGRWTGLTILTCLAIFTAASLVKLSRTGGDGDSVLLLAHHLGVGLVYGLVSQCAWMAGCIDRQPRRWSAAMAITVVGAVLMAIHIGTRSTQFVASNRLVDFLQQLAHLSGVVIAQSVLFYFLGIVTWRHRGVIRPNSRPAQFSVLHLVVLTLAVAVLLAIAMRYPTPIHASRYWAVWLGIWIGMPTIAAAGARASTDPSWWRRTLAVIVCIFLAGAAALTLVAIDRVSHETLTLDQERFIWQGYGTLIFAFAACCLALPLAGRVDQQLFLGRQPSDPRID